VWRRRRAVVAPGVRARGRRGGDGGGVRGVPGGVRGRGGRARAAAVRARVPRAVHRHVAPGQHDVSALPGARAAQIVAAVRAHRMKAVASFRHFRVTACTYSFNRTSTTYVATLLCYRTHPAQERRNRADIETKTSGHLYSVLIFTH
jgi:hypothetical protein